jgi:HPt (histidine-containing phosphotransfer) domain-containing protein
MPSATAALPEREASAERTVMTQSDDAGRPLVDQSVLDRLREELDEDEGYCTVFVGNFIDYLPRRIGRLRLALTTGDLEGAVDAVLSLKTSSQMVGAERLAGLALDLESAIRSDSSHSDVAVALPRLAAAYLKPINQCSKQTLHRLQAQRSTGANR